MEMDPESEPQTVFVVQNTVYVVVRDINSLGEILAAVVTRALTRSTVSALISKTPPQLMLKPNRKRLMTLPARHRKSPMLPA